MKIIFKKYSSDLFTIEKHVKKWSINHGSMPDISEDNIIFQRFLI